MHLNAQGGNDLQVRTTFQFLPDPTGIQVTMKPKYQIGPGMSCTVSAEIANRIWGGHFLKRYFWQLDSVGASSSSSVSVTTCNALEFQLGNDSNYCRASFRPPFSTSSRII